MLRRTSFGMLGRGLVVMLLAIGHPPLAKGKQPEAVIPVDGSQAILNHLQTDKDWIGLIRSVVSQQLLETHLSKKEFGSIVALSRSIDYEVETTMIEVQHHLRDKGVNCSFIYEGDGQELFFPSLEEEDNSDEARRDMDYPREPVETDVPPPKKEGGTYAEKAHEFAQRVRDLKLFLEGHYASYLLKKEITDKHIYALSETLARVPPSKWEEQKSNLVTRIPSRLYDWAISNSSIVYPFLSLNEAAEKLSTSSRYIPKTSWGLVDGVYKLPKAESVSDSSLWSLIKDTLIARFGEDKVSSEAETDSSVPNLDRDLVAKDSSIGTIWLRILELFRSPGSANIRKNPKTSDDSIRNMVDFYVLDQIRIRDQASYKSLIYNSDALNYRRKVKVSNNVTDAKGKTNVVVTEIFAGYRLSEMLNKYLEKRTNLVPEKEAFCLFVFSVLDNIVAANGEKYSLPATLFIPASLHLRAKLRHGPEISRRGKVAKANLYIPFSFTKASECSRLPESVKKDLTALGADILKNIDVINSLTIKEQSNLFPFFDGYLSQAYNLSDEFRKVWRLDAKYPSNVSDLRARMVDRFPSVADLYKEVSRTRFIEDVRRYKITSVAASTDAVDQGAIRAEINKIINDRTTARKSRRT